MAAGGVAPTWFFVWGGDGMAQRCIDTLARDGHDGGDRPAGTANLLASNLGIPKDIEGAVTGLEGREREIDVGSMNGERFAVMAGAGFDADMIGGADGGLKDRSAGRRTSGPARGASRTPPFTAKITVDGGPGSTAGQLHPAPATSARCSPASGCSTMPSRTTAVLDIAVITAEGRAEWARTVGRTIAGPPDQSPFFRSTQGRTMSK